ncbi:MAG: group 1 glycosyl transferase [Candidatus Peregrinibacteria bacterium Gr01-1014_25]|nr:MAG: group 1 glycosyl transferase [Candidatus Peregrinibacteria bacterium Gr01-1014_25]
MKTILLISPYWREPHRWMVSSVKLAELWQRLGFRIVVGCMGGTGGQRAAGSGKRTSVEDVSPTLRIYRMRDRFLPDPLNFGIALGFARMARRIIRIERPDMVVINKVLFWTSFSIIPLRLRGHRVVVLTDALVGMTWQPRGWPARIIMTAGAWTVGWLVLLCAHRVVFFHPQPPRLLRFLGIAHKCEVIPTGIDPSGYGLLAMGSEQRKSHSSQLTAHSSIVVTYIGRLESVKGVDDFLAAAVEAKRHHPQITIRVVGWYKEGHPLVARYADRVTFTGLRDDIPTLLAESDIFVLPSYSEGLSNALMEAMASGCACVASDVGGNRFLIENDVSGLLFPAGDRAALAAHLRRLADDPVKRIALGAAARRRIEDHFSWDMVGKLYKRLIDQVLREEGTTA